MVTKILSHQQQAIIRNEWLIKRFKGILPRLMMQEQIDLWLIAAREYNDDPVLQSLMPVPLISGDEGFIMPTTQNWMFLVFKLEGDHISAYMVNGPGIGNVSGYELVYPKSGEDEWQCLYNLISDLQPAKIGLNYSDTFAHADGISLTAYQKLKETFDARIIEKFCSAEHLCVRWLETRLPEELACYPELIILSHQIISDAFSSAVITPNQTTVEDISWWMRQRITEYGLKSWFMPMVSFLREDKMGRSYTGTVKPGDMLHCDMGIRYLGLLADTQQLGYILKSREHDVPSGLKHGMRLANRLQDIHIDQLKAGITGNEVLHKILYLAKQEDINGKVWSHPIGYHGHGAGPLIGTYNKQDGVPRRGDYLIQLNSCFAMELCIFSPLPEWGDQEVSFNLEETIALASLTDHNVSQAIYFSERQTEFHIIN